MTEYIINDLCQHILERHGAETLDGYLLVPSNQGGGVLVLACSENEYQTVKALALDLVSRHVDRVSSVCIYYVGPSNFTEELQIQGRRFYVCNLGWVWWDDYELLGADEALGKYIRRHSATNLSLQLQQLPRGQGKAFEDLLATILNFTLPSAVARLDQGVRSWEGTKIRDFKLTLRIGCALQAHFQRAGLPCNNLLVEAKNQTREIGDDVTQVQGYLGATKFASVGLFITRAPLTSALQRLVMEANCDGERGHRVLIIPLDDGHVQQLIANAGSGDFLSNEQMLINEAERALNAVY
jgi:hypothetical protein